VPAKSRGGQRKRVSKLATVAKREIGLISEEMGGTISWMEAKEWCTTGVLVRQDEGRVIARTHRRKGISLTTPGYVSGNSFL